MSALFMAMILTGAGGMADAQAAGMPPPVPVPYIVPPPSPPPAPPTQRPRLLQGSFVDYFTPADYPANALPPGGYAYVAFSVAVGPDGRVTTCTIYRSSGAPALDAATCRVVRERARYSPALDPAGQPAAGRHGGGIMWEAPTAAGAPARISIPAPPPPRVAPPQRARANLSSYFSVDDYPALALRANHQGTTSFRLTIGIDGRVTVCEVTSSSNSEPLDQATCRILRSRARYVAARDADGTPMIGHDSGRVTWSLPGDDLPDRAGLAQAYRPARLLSGEVREAGAADYPPGAPPPSENENVSEVRIAIGREGQVIGCDVKTGSGSPALDAAACRLLTERARFEPARDQAGAAICDLAWEFVNWGPAAAARPPAQPGTRQPPTRVPRPLREQLNASLC
jgi:TonB family protein